MAEALALYFANELKEQMMLPEEKRNYEWIAKCEAEIIRLTPVHLNSQAGEPLYESRCSKCPATLSSASGALVCPIPSQTQPPAHGVPHHHPLIGGTRKLIVIADISNKSNDELFINVPLHVDGGCEMAELVLLQEDIEALGLNPTGEIIKGEQTDGSMVTVIEYERVFLQLTTDNGDIWACSVHPVVLSTPITFADTAPGVPAVIDTSRLLGYGGINRLGLKQDFVHHKLIKVVKRI